MIRHPAYAEKTIGVISMIGESQAVLIQSLLHKEIDGIELEKRRIQAGISGEFQGDERDVMFLTMVDSAAEEGTLRAIGDGAFEQTKKRYNVAASRARDQMWVVHSFDPDLHLKSSDLRFRLLQHVKDPLAALRAFNREVTKTESPFEREVLKRLTAAGFRVKAQWQVGYFRIDMVVEGNGKRLAVECDGDRYHPLEKLADDMSRQAILERLGWKFVRIRGSAFYRGPELAMRAVFASLEEQEIFPSADREDRAETDLTLVRELDNLVRQEFDSAENDKVVSFENATPAGNQASLPKVHPLSADRRVLVLDGEEVAPPTATPPVSQAAKVPFNHYVEYAGPRGDDPRDCSLQQVSEGIIRIVDAEGPVIAKRVYDIYLRSCGIKRMGHELRTSLNGALAIAIQQKHLIAVQEGQETDPVFSVVRAMETPPVRLRTRGSRSLEEIPLSELQLVSRYLQQRRDLKSGSEEHLRAILECLELKRLTTQAGTILQEAMGISFPFVDDSLSRIQD